MFNAENLTNLRQKIFFTLIILLVYRIGGFIPLPGIDPYALSEFTKSASEGILGMFNMLSGGSLERMTIFALAIMPYITASIIMQLLSVISSDLEAIKKQGETGRKKINQYTRFLTVGLAIVQSFGIAVGLEAIQTTKGSIVIDPGTLFKVITMITLTGGTVLLMWLGEQITARGIGNGTSMIIFTGIICGLPKAVIALFELTKAGSISIVMMFFIIIIVTTLIWCIVFFEKAQRRIPIQYAKRQMGNKLYNAENTHLPLKLNTSGVIPPIFASSILLFPITIINFLPPEMKDAGILGNLSIYLGHGKPLYLILYIALIVFFAFFYTGIVFNVDETAENFKKNGAIILGKRPGAATSLYLKEILFRITTIGAVYIATVCIIPELIIGKYNIPFYLGGTSMLIVVNVITDTIVQIQTHLFSGQYKKIAKKMNFTGKGL